MNKGLNYLRIFSRQGRTVLNRNSSRNIASFKASPVVRSLPTLSVLSVKAPSSFKDSNLGQRGYATMSFEEAVKKSTSMKDPDNSTKLRMYALYKQATAGKATGDRPGAMNFVARAKFDAWNELGDMSSEDAKKEYVSIVQSGLGDTSEGKGSTSTATSSSGLGRGTTEGIVVTVQDGIRTIRLNRPEKYNALTPDMYRAIATALNESNDDPNTNVVVLASTGNFYCSGNDLGTFMNVSDPMKMAKDGRDLLLEYIDAYIYCKKPLVAIVNGPAVGISVTVLGLCDLVFCSDKATFNTPFSAIGQSPEACSSYTFPRIMGYAKSSELLMFNQKITAGEAEKVGLVTAVIPHDRLQEETGRRVKEIASLPLKSLVYSKDLIRGRERDLLHEINVKECDRLQERWISEDCINAIQKFFTRKSKV